MGCPPPCLDWSLTSLQRAARRRYLPVGGRRSVGAMFASGTAPTERRPPGGMVSAVVVVIVRRAALCESRPVPQPEHPDGDAVQAVDLLRCAAGRAAPERDLVAREEPLEIQLRGATLAVVMRTPGHDAELVRGFLVTERVVRQAADIAAIRHCSVVSDPDAEDNVINVTLREGLTVDLEALRRNLFASSSCGVCGKATMENALAVPPPLDDPARFDAGFFRGLADRLAAAQPIFARTGGLHAAALVAPDGALLAVREDIGRHNA